MSAAQTGPGALLPPGGQEQLPAFNQCLQTDPQPGHGSTHTHTKHTPHTHTTLPPPTQMLNSHILANRRSVAQLVLLLREETLQQESVLHLNWEEHVTHWRSIKVQQVIQGFR